MFNPPIIQVLLPGAGPWLALLFSVAVQLTPAQSTSRFSVLVKPVFGNSELGMEDTYYKLNVNDSARITTLRFYLSEIELCSNGSPVYTEPDSYHLVDAGDAKSCKLAFAIPAGLHFNSIKFSLGIDSATNVSGAIGGDLDPSRGMYWTWQSGYINFKLEGVSNLCRTRKNVFQFHLGGYQAPYAAAQTVELKISEQAATLYFDVEKLLKEIDLAKQNEIMSPGAEGIAISKLASRAFRTN